jgi:antitoxin HicB
MIRKIEKTVEYYLSLPYTVEVAPISNEDGGGFNACIPLLGRWSAVGDGETEAAAIRRLHNGLPSLIAAWLRDGVTIPEPSPTPEKLASGKLSVRLPIDLHARLMEEAERNAVSINQFIVAAIARAVGEGAGTSQVTQ